MRTISPELLNDIGKLYHKHGKEIDEFLQMTEVEKAFLVISTVQAVKGIRFEGIKDAKT